MLKHLERYFAPEDDGVFVGGPHRSLAIVAGSDGARLTHSHTRQFDFARQSLLLWRAITHDMFRLWFLAEEDLLSPDTPYALKQTGQGLQRVQPSPRTYETAPPSSQRGAKIDVCVCFLRSRLNFILLQSTLIPNTTTTTTTTIMIPQGTARCSSS